MPQIQAESVAPFMSPVARAWSRVPVCSAAPMRSSTNGTCDTGTGGGNTLPGWLCEPGDVCIPQAGSCHLTFPARGGPQIFAQLTGYT
jgi:hypothetical protein